MKYLEEQYDTLLNQESLPNKSIPVQTPKPEGDPKPIPTPKSKPQTQVCISCKKQCQAKDIEKLQCGHYMCQHCKQTYINGGLPYCPECGNQF